MSTTNALSSAPAAARSKFREDDASAAQSSVNVAPTRLRITPRETLTFQIRNTSGNLILDAATPLIGLAIRLRHMEACDDIDELHRRVHNDIEAFDTELRNRGYDAPSVIAARYCLCSFIDESMMSTPWGADSFWPERTMLSIFHNQAWGGEQFFGVLERVLDQSSRYQDLLEFLYICVGMGFEGKFHVMHNGRNMLDRLLDTVYQMMIKHRGEAPDSLCAPEANIVINRENLRNNIPLWFISCIGAACLTAIYLAFRIPLEKEIAQITKAISDIL